LRYSFKGRKVLVTGGQGIGFQIAKSFYDDGAIVIVISKSVESLNQVKAAMPNAKIFCHNLTEWDSTRKLIESLGPLDHLVNNAGVSLNNSLLTATEQEFDLSVGVNLKALISCSVAFVNAIKNSGLSTENAGRTIVNISSIADRLVLGHAGIYNATKAGVTMLTKVMAQEFSEYGIRVNAVSPGFVNTSMVRSNADDLLKLWEEKLYPRILLKGPIKTEDVANCVLFLSSPLSIQTTGESLLTDGGITI